MAAKFNFVHQSIQNYIKICRERPKEALVFAFLVVTASLTYIFGTFQVLPILMADYDSVYYHLASAVTTWIVFGVLSNLFLIRIRDSSIRNRMLLQPLINPPPPTYWEPTAGETSPSDEQLIKEHTKYMGQQFMARPYGEEESWHICASCEIFVPPRAWHCHSCRTCILRRDHHCIFTMCCIGEENHCNFMGMVFYLAIGTTLSTVLSMMYTVWYTDTVWWVFIIKSFVPVYTLFFDFNVINLLAGICMTGQGAAWGMFLYYCFLAAKGQTSADGSRGINRASQGRSKYSMNNVTNMLGPSPFLRLIWPFHPILKLSYGDPVIPEDQTRKGL